MWLKFIVTCWHGRIVNIVQVWKGFRSLYCLHVYCKFTVWIIIIINYKYIWLIASERRAVTNTNCRLNLYSVFYNIQHIFSIQFRTFIYLVLSCGCTIRNGSGFVLKGGPNNLQGTDCQRVSYMRNLINHFYNSLQLIVNKWPALRRKEAKESLLFYNFFD